jgi:hypothetical protein
MDLETAITIYNQFKRTEITVQNFREQRKSARQAINAILKTGSMVEDRGGHLVSRQVIASLITTAEMFSTID